jgi:hypothetical protein
VEGNGFLYISDLAGSEKNSIKDFSSTNSQEKEKVLKIQTEVHFSI